MPSTPPAPEPSNDKNEPAPAVPAAERTPLWRRESFWLLAGVVGLLGLFTYLAGKGTSRPSGAASDVRVERIDSELGGGRLFACAPGGSPCQELAPQRVVPRGSLLKTDFSTRAVLSLGSGSQLWLERGSELSLSNASSAKLERGSLLAEIASGRSTLVLALPQGKLSTRGAKLVVRESGEASSVDVLRGNVELESESGRHDSARAGETARITRTLTEVGPAPLLAPLAFDDESARSTELAQTARGVGELKARKPGARDETSGAVRLASHSVRVRIAGAMARTEIEEVFANSSDETLEGIYRFPIPPDAKLERLALDVDGKLVDGAFVDRDRAAAIWRGAIVNAAPQAKPPIEDIVWVPGPWRDPALLEWQRGGRFELRIFPIPRRGQRRVVLSYTQLVPPTGTTRRYSYPLGGVKQPIARFSLDVAVRGNDAAFGVQASGYPLTRGVDGGATTLTLSQENATPSGDLGVEYALPNPNAELRAWAYAPSEAEAQGDARRDLEASASERAPYAAIALRPVLPRARERAPLGVAIVVDSSRSMFGESYERAKELAARLIREVDADTRLALLACDSSCRVAREPLEPGALGERGARSFLEKLEADGASDPTRAVQAAARALAELGRAEGRIIYIGDGAATMGPLRPSHIESETARTLSSSGVRLTAVAVGGEADADSLQALARGGKGVMVRYAPGESVAQAAFAVLGASYGRALSDVSVTLPDGLYAVAPSRLDAIAAGSEALVVARMSRSSVEGEVTLRGRVGGERFERRYPIRLSASSESAALFVPRLYAALRISDLERDGSAEAKRDALALSTRFNVGSRYTSLLVLESEAMFNAFGLARTRSEATWSGEEVAEEAASESEEARLERAAPELEQAAPMGNATSGSAPAKRAARARTDGKIEMSEDFAGSAARGAPAPASPPAAAPASPPAAAKPKARSAQALDVASAWPGVDEPLEPIRPQPSLPPPPPARRMIPMRRIWKRTADIASERLVPRAASFDALAQAERLAQSDADRRDPLRKLYALQLRASDDARAEQTVARWLSRDPLDADALTARADLAARRADRELAIRLLGSVLDARPGDVAAGRRLERLERWAGRSELGCRYLIAAAESKPSDVKLTADAIRCSRASGDELSERELVAGLSASLRATLEARLREPVADDSVLQGDFKVQASWSGGEDLDLGIVDPDGRRVSFLGAPTRAVISARDVTARDREGLALRGSATGEYVVEIVRSEPGSQPQHGELTISVANTSRRIPFHLSGERVSVALVNVRQVSELVPVEFSRPRAGG